MRKVLTRSTLVLIFILVVSFALFRTGHQRHLEQALDLSLPRGEITSYLDTHSGFHGDGDVYAIMQLNQRQGSTFAAKLSQREGWHSGAVSETLSLALYGGERDGVTYGPCGKDLPQVQDGFWYFQDRSGEGSSPYSDRDLLSRSAQNFTFALYNPEDSTLYFYELDT